GEGELDVSVRRSACPSDRPILCENWIHTTAPRISAIARKVRALTGSRRISQPSSTAITGFTYAYVPTMVGEAWRDRKSTRLNSSHVAISYAVFCLKKKNR